MALEDEDPDDLECEITGDCDDTTDDTTDDGGGGGGGGGGISSWADLSLPGYLTDLKSVSDKLVAIAKNPRSFVLGAILSALLAGVLDLFNTVVDALRMVLIGSKLGYAEYHEFIGLEDLPLILWEVIGAPFGSIGGIVIGLVNSLQSTAETFAMELGIFAYPAAVAFIVLTIIATERTVSTISKATLASIPVVGSFLEVILYR